MGNERKVLFNVLFYVRLIAYLSAIFFFRYVPAPLLIATGVIFLTWTLDFVLGNTLWLSARWETYAIQIPAIAFIIWFTQIAFHENWGIIVMAPVAMVALSSDAIANSKRWQLLICAMFVAILIIEIAPRLTSPVDKAGFLQDGVSAGLLVFAMIPAFACLARLFFPRTKHLIHTSLDYPPIRVEILSFGMKRPAAIGIKRM